MRPGLPEARRVVVAGDADEAELLVVVRADELHRVQRAALERGVDVGGGDLRRHRAQALEHLPARPAMRNFSPRRSSTRLDLVAEPAAHLRAGVARREAHDAVVAEQLRRELVAAAMLQPGEVLPRVQAEGQRGEEGEGGVLADVVVDRRVAGLDGAGLHRVQHLEARDDLAGGEEADLEAVLRQRRHPLGDALAGAEQHVEVARERRRTCASAPPARLGPGRGRRGRRRRPAAAAPRRRRAGRGGVAWRFLPSGGGRVPRAAPAGKGGAAAVPPRTLLLRDGRRAARVPARESAGARAREGDTRWIVDVSWAAGPPRCGRRHRRRALLARPNIAARRRRRASAGAAPTASRRRSTRSTAPRRSCPPRGEDVGRRLPDPGLRPRRDRARPADPGRGEPGLGGVRLHVQPLLLRQGPEPRHLHHPAHGHA